MLIKNGEKTLQFPVENASVIDYVKAGVFGKYALPMAKEYTDRGYKSLNAKQTKMYEEAKLPYRELTDYIDTKLTKKEDKIEYISSKDYTDEQKWGLYKYDVFSNVERDDGSTQLSDIEYMVSNGVSKGDFIELYNKMQKYDIDVPKQDEYKELKDSGISLKTYVDYKINVKNKTESKRNSGELKEEQQLKTADKIQILLDAKYSDSEKQALYENYIVTDDKSSDSEKQANLSYRAMKAAKVHIDEILKYKMQEFTSDKKDDGTLTGKTVSKSKQNKVVNYLNSVHSEGCITGNQSLLIYAINGYSTTFAQKSQLFNYVKSLEDLSNKDKLELCDKFSGFKVYKDGRVTW